MHYEPEIHPLLAIAIAALIWAALATLLWWLLP
jgi:hypothetical protein